MEGYINDNENEKKIEEEEFLSNVLEIREEIEFCDDSKKLNSIDNDNNQRIKGLIGEIRVSLNDKNYSIAIERLAKLQYAISIQDAIFNKNYNH